MNDLKSYISADLLRAVAADYQLDPRGIHGYAHWARVCEFGRRLADGIGIDRRLLELFALVHDCRRSDDGHDVEHGPRAAAALRGWHGSLIQLPEEDFQSLIFACEHHTDGQVSQDQLVGACWDADRLDLSRLGYEIDVSLLSTWVAKDPATLEWAKEMSEKLVVPEVLNTEWALLLSS